MIIIIDGHDIRYTNIADLADGAPISIENLRVHFLAKGNSYILSEKKYVAQHESEFEHTEVE
jgi:cyanophycinase